MAGLARRWLKRNFWYLFYSIAANRSFLDVIPDVPDQIKFLAVFPYKIRLWIFRHIPHFIKSRIPLIRQNNIRQAASELGWKGEPLLNLFNLLKADLTIVNDLPDYYDQSKFSKNVIFTGPLFAKTVGEEPIDPEIQKVFDSQNRKIKIFCTLSSSGSKEMLKEVIKVFTYGDGLNWNAVILSPHFSVEEAYEILGKREGVYITDKFIPAQKVNAMAILLFATADKEQCKPPYILAHH
jgi:hypothetical protein